MVRVVQFLHFFNLVVVAPKNVLILGRELFLNPIAGLDVSELVEQVKGLLRGAEIVLESVSDELDDL